ncbi:hypothetical protein QQ008_29060 [Fulvivirgaceae bacterium BMA10]|uniref:ABC transmembrane type-1 domain-containing protein n=1 Tax=Splendidivirga corallicola TaxID=3051826 RepID=A0ABT8KYP4_9BACT|nr:hypothetical protein [Fulvivirgaceae bacterium BMA10]
MLFNSAFFNEVIQGGSLTQTFLLILIQFWQYGFLFAYLFWLNIQNTPHRINEFSIAVGTTRFEKIRDVILPHSRNLFILLLFISFIFAFYEDTKSQLILRASQGTDTELISHWLYRTYQSNLLINPEYASNSVFTHGLIVFFVAMLFILVLGLLVLLSFRVISRTRSIDGKKSSSKTSLFSRSFGIISIAIILVPVLIALVKSSYSIAENISSITFPFAITLIASFSATTLAVAFGISSRLTFTKMLSDFNTKSLLYFLAIFLIQMVPPLFIILSGFKWLSWVGYKSDFIIYIIWLIGHCVLTLPLLGSFIMAIHFSVREHELDYLRAYKIPFEDILKYSFMTRFKVQYALTLIFAFTFIWNDAGLNMVLSDNIPSFVSNLQMLLIGRAADYSQATSFVLVAIVMSLTCVLIWRYIISKSPLSEVK